MDLRDISSYDLAQILTQAHQIELAINSLNATIASGEIELIEKSSFFLNQSLTYLNVNITQSVLKEIDVYLPQVFYQIEDLTRAINSIRDVLTFKEISKLSLGFFGIGVLLAILGSVIIIEYQRWRLVKPQGPIEMPITMGFPEDAFIE